MTLNLIGLGLDYSSISKDALDVAQKSDKIFLESYTVDFPYDIKILNDLFGKEITSLERASVENEDFLEEAKDNNITLLVYGDPFSATTHHQIVISCLEKRIPIKIYHNASIINSIAESGLSLYKFGKISSMPKWLENYHPTSFLNYVRENDSINAHSLLLIDIGLEFPEAINQLKTALKDENMDIEKIIVCSSIGTERKSFYYKTLDELSNIQKISKPFCIIIPSKLHFIEEEYIKNVYNSF